MLTAEIYITIDIKYFIQRTYQRLHNLISFIDNLMLKSRKRYKYF